nr:helix-turn-helix domain-containing protein [Rhizobium ruizarguesonis]
MARLNAGETIRSIAAALAIARSCVSKWKKRLAETGALTRGRVGGRKYRTCPASGRLAAPTLPIRPVHDAGPCGGTGRTRHQNLSDAPFECSCGPRVWVSKKGPADRADGEGQHAVAAAQKTDRQEKFGIAGAGDAPRRTREGTTGRRAKQKHRRSRGRYQGRRAGPRRRPQSQWSKSAPPGFKNRERHLWGYSSGHQGADAKYDIRHDWKIKEIRGFCLSFPREG